MSCIPYPGDDVGGRKISQVFSSTRFVLTPRGSILVIFDRIAEKNYQLPLTAYQYELKHAGVWLDNYKRDQLTDIARRAEAEREATNSGPTGDHDAPVPSEEFDNVDPTFQEYIDVQAQTVANDTDETRAESANLTRDKDNPADAVMGF